MDVMNPKCAGLDIHKATIKACVRSRTSGGKVGKWTREFATNTRDILRMGDWLASHGVTVVAMESTGVFWKPIYNLIEGRFRLELWNAQHIKRVPGRKSDIQDCDWICELLQFGLVRASFVPTKPLRELRDLTRHRVNLTGEHTRTANQIHKVLEDANIKLGCVATDILGRSGRDMIGSLVAGEVDPEKLADLARGRLRGKIPELKLALEGRVTEHHRYMLTLHFNHLQFLEQSIEDLTARIDRVLGSIEVPDAPESPLPFPAARELLTTIPGIDNRSAENVLAETGTDMARFPTPQNLASWAGVCPGTCESAGKRKPGRTRKGNRWLRRALTQAAWAASRTKDTYLSAQYHRLAKRRGKKRAIVAVAHTLLVIVHRMLTTRTAYDDLGPLHFDNINPERLTKWLVKRLEALGHQVVLNPNDASAA